MELVILKSPLMYVLLVCIAAIHIAAAVITALKRERLFASPMLLAAILEGVALALHVVIVFFGLINGASADEILLTLLISGAVGLVAIGAAEKKRDVREEEEGGDD